MPREAGRIRVRKRVESHQVARDVERGIEAWEVERVPADADDSGEVESLADGSVSVPLFAEEIVVDRRKVVRERVVIEKGEIRERRRLHDERRVETVEVEEERD